MILVGLISRLDQLLFVNGFQPGRDLSGNFQRQLYGQPAGPPK
jgi:hypothetical protein